MSGTPNYLKAGDINRSTRSHEIVDYLHTIKIHLYMPPSSISKWKSFNNYIVMAKL